MFFVKKCGDKFLKFTVVRFDQLKNLQKFYEILDCGSFCLEEVAAWPS